MSTQDLVTRRQDVADAAYADAEFELRVEADNGWDINADGDVWIKKVFMDVGLDDTKMMQFSVEFVGDTAELAGPASYDEPAWEGHVAENRPIYGYYVNRSDIYDFYADVRNEDGQTIFEVKTAVEESVWEFSADEFMDHVNDIAGLQEHLIEMGIIRHNGEVMTFDRFEAELDLRQADRPGM